MKKILLQGYYGEDNLGDDYILLSIIDSLKNIDNIHIDCLVSKNVYNFFMQKYKYITFFEKNKSRIYNQLIHCKLIIKNDYWIIGGGGLFPTENIKALFVYTFKIILASILKKKVILYGIEINSMEKNMSKSLWKAITNMVDFISTRNMQTKNLLINLNSTFTKKVFNYSDVTFALQTEKEFFTQDSISDIKHFSGLPTPYILWGLAMPWNPTELETAHYQERYEMLCNQIAKICDYFINYTHVFLPFYYNSDIAFIGDVIKKIKSPYLIIDKKSSINLDEKRLIFKYADFCFCMRYHSVLFALYHEKPFFSISYSPKTSWFLREYSLDDRFVEIGVRQNDFFMKEFDIDTPVLVEKAIKAISFNANDEKAIRNASQHAKHLAYLGKKQLLDWLDLEHD